MKHIGGVAAIGVAMLIGSGLSAPPAQAVYIVTVQQVGSNVVATGSGTLDLTGLTFVERVNSSSGDIHPSIALLYTGPTISGPVDFYFGLTGPTKFGSGGEIFANSGSGQPVGLTNFAAAGDLVVPAGYASGSALSDTTTWDNQTFTTLGVTPGTYEWTWGSGANQNFTLDIETVAVPAPVIGQGPPIFLVVGGVLFGAKLLERSRKAHPCY